MVSRRDLETATEVNLVQLVEAKGIKLVQRGQQLVGTCPFHDGDGPTLVVGPSTNSWSCSTCGSSGGPIEWLMKAEGVSHRHALELLRGGVPKGLGTPAQAASRQKGTTPTTSTRRWLKLDLDPDAPDDELLGQVVSFYNRPLLSSPEAMAYLEARGLADPELIERYQLGYANRTLGYHIPNARLKLGGVLRRRLQQIGIYRQTGREHFNGCLVIPITDESGTVVQMYGRKIGERLRNGTPLHLSLPTEVNPIWNVAALGEDKAIILCEGIIDGLTFWAAGHRNVVAVLGPDSFTADHVQAIKAHGVEQVYIAFDRDDEGERGAWAATALLAPEGIEVLRVMFPPGLDANDVAVAAVSSKQALLDALRSARWIGGTPKTAAPSEPAPKAVEPDGFDLWIERYLEWLRVRNYSDKTIEGRQVYLGLFTGWADTMGITTPTDITKAHLETYQRFLFHKRKRNGKPLSARSQHTRLVAVRAWFKWMTRQNVIPTNPASELELPKLGRRLPKAILTVSEAERVMAVPDLTEPLALRDRAIMETLWSSGIRRQELIDLGVWSIDYERGTLMVRQGKGKRDRMIPIGERATMWVRRYLDDVRPSLVVPPDEGVLFLSSQGEPLGPRRLTQLVGAYVEQAKLGKRGACHLWRHTMATLMLEGGADIRFIQAMLGHVLLSTTQLYTQVSIRKLKQIHTATHPAATLADRGKPATEDADDDNGATLDDLLGDLDAEDEDDSPDGA